MTIWSSGPNRASRDQRTRELSRVPKNVLASMHKQNGGLMPLATYRKWTKAELVNEILEDEGYTR